MNVSMMVVTNIDTDAMSTIDTGRMRRLSDVLGIHGHSYAISIASALSMLNGYINGKFDTGKFGLVDYDTLLQLLEAHPDLASAVVPGRRAALNIGAAPRAIIVGLYLTCRAAPRKADEFKDGLITGANLKQGDPRLVLRTVCRDANRRGKSERHKAIDHLGLYIKAWNMWIKEQKVTTIRLDKTEPIQSVLGSGGRPIKLF